MGQPHYLISYADASGRRLKGSDVAKYRLNNGSNPQCVLLLTD